MYINIKCIAKKTIESLSSLSMIESKLLLNMHIQPPMDKSAESYSCHPPSHKWNEVSTG